MRLRSHLFLLVAAAVLPIVVFSAVIATILLEQERESFRRSAMERTRALMTAVDAQLRGSVATLGALATSRNLERNYLRAFHEETLRVLATQPGWLNISLALPSGRQLANTGTPFGNELPVIADIAGVERAVKTLRAEALETIGAFAPSLVFLDIGMPGMDGYQVARAIRERFPRRRATLVALTGWGQESDRRAARAAGFDHPLVKPVEIGALRTLLASVESESRLSAH